VHLPSRRTGAMRQGWRRQVAATSALAPGRSNISRCVGHWSKAGADWCDTRSLTPFCILAFETGLVTRSAVLGFRHHVGAPTPDVRARHPSRQRAQVSVADVDCSKEGPQIHNRRRHGSEGSESCDQKEQFDVVHHFACVRNVRSAGCRGDGDCEGSSPFAGGCGPSPPSAPSPRDGLSKRTGRAFAGARITADDRNAHRRARVSDRPRRTAGPGRRGSVWARLFGSGVRPALDRGVDLPVALASQNQADWRAARGRGDVHHDRDGVLFLANVWRFPGLHFIYCTCKNASSSSGNLCLQAAGDRNDPGAAAPA
jgi:hypothetical protein